MLVAAHKKIRKRIFDGTPSQLKPIKKDLLMWIFEQREQSLAVTMQHAILKACLLLKDCFAGKSFEAPKKAALCFLNKNTAIRVRAGTKHFRPIGFLHRN
jgi:hypothetical protein